MRPSPNRVTDEPNNTKRSNGERAPATINVTILKTRISARQVEVSATDDTARFSNTPHQAAVCGLKPDLVAINGAQLFKR